MNFGLNTGAADGTVLPSYGGDLVAATAATDTRMDNDNVANPQVGVTFENETGVA